MNLFLAFNVKKNIKELFSDIQIPDEAYRLFFFFVVVVIRKAVKASGFQHTQYESFRFHANVFVAVFLLQFLLCK